MKQFQQEATGWKRVLAFLLQENAYLKMRLSDVVSNNGMSDDRLAIAEDYQAKLIRNEEIINLMRTDITALESQLTRACNEDRLETPLELKQKDLRREFREVVVAFNDLKFNFNDYIADNY
ncbi:MAG TPA: hypothetical protein VGD17_11265 [Chitinophagaceae bacterium]